MLIRLRCRALVTITVLFIVSLTVSKGCTAQGLSPKAAIPAPIREEQPAFDKLELFGFLAAGPIGAYAKQVIQARGTDFTPDTAFVHSFPVFFQETLNNVHPRAVKTTSPDRDAAYELLKRAWEAKQNRRYPEANESYQQALQLAPTSATLHLAYAACLLLSQRYAEAEDQARRSIKLWPRNAEAHGLIALALVAQKHFAEAESESREALQIFPEHHSATFTLGVSLVHEQKYKEAVPLLQDAIITLPQIATIRKLLGISLFETGEVEKGTSELNSYVKNSPEDAEGHYYLGVALRSKGHLEEAHSQFAEAFRLQPNNPQYEAAVHPDSSENTKDAVSESGSEDGSVSENVYTNRFFGFRYEFPKGWVSLSSEAARGMLEMGGAFLSTGDPTEQDVKKAASRKRHPLLYVVEGRVANQPLSMQSVMISAFDIRTTPELMPDGFLKSVDQQYKQKGLPMKLSGAPEEITIGGRAFWKGNFAVHTATGNALVSQFVTKDKGYLLLVVVGSRDLASRQVIEKSLESFRFVDSAN